jgi:hypothetical protein
MLKFTVGIRIYPGTAFEKIARKESIITEEDDLLLPRFYLARRLDEWLASTIRSWMTYRKYLFII